MTPTARESSGAPAQPAGESAGRLGVFGGTFDPPHVAHVALAAWVRSALHLDRVLMVVAGDPWQKSGSRPVTAGDHRLAMVRLACEGVEGVEACDLEVRRPGPSYTVETLEELVEAGEQPVLIVGADALDGLVTWHRHGDLVHLAELAVVDREGVVDAAVFDPETAGFVTHRVGMPRLDISSSMLRGRLRAGEPVDGLLPPGVVAYIRAHGLYREHL